MYPRPLHYSVPPPRAPDVIPYPPGVDEPRLPHHYRGNAYHRPRPQRLPYRPHSPANGALPMGYVFLLVIKTNILRKLSSFYFIFLECK